MPYIYKITNDINNKIYVGKTAGTIDKRWREHCADYKKFKGEKRPLYEAMKKYGIEHFYIEQLEEVASLEELDEKEKYWIEKLGSFHYGYNATKGGEGKAYADYDLIYNLYINQNLSSKEITAITGYDNITINRALDCHGIDKEQRQDIIVTRKGKPVLQIDIETNKVLAVFPTCSAAQRIVSHNPSEKNSGSHISAVCRGKRKTAYGYRWQYAY